MFKIKPYQQILIALILATVCGLLTYQFFLRDEIAEEAVRERGEGIVAVYDYIGALFMRALKMVIVPLIVTSIVVGIAGLGHTAGFGRLGIKTLLYYMMTSFLAIVTGLTMVNVFQPGREDGKPNQEILKIVEARKDALEEKAREKTGGAEARGFGVVAETFKRMIPPNVFKAATENGQMLSLIFVSLLIAFGILCLRPDERKPLMDFFQSANALVLVITNWIMLFAPVGVFGLVAAALSQSGGVLFYALLKYFFVVIGALSVHFLIVLPVILIVLGRVNPLRHYEAMRNALLTAFSTASSSATLPVTMRAVQENAGVSARVSSFVLPLGATVNMDGTALYECVAVIFIAQVMGVDLGLAEQFLVVVLALLTSIGVAGIPSASLVAITIIVGNVGIDGAAAFIGAILAVDRLLDMSRTAVNIFSDSCGAVVIARSEGEENILSNPMREVEVEHPPK